MLKVKVLKVGELLIKFIFHFVVILLCYLLVILLVKMNAQTFSHFSLSLVKQTVGSDESSLQYVLDKKIIQKELSVKMQEKKIEIEKDMLEEKKYVDDGLVHSKQELIVENPSNFLSSEKVKHFSRPSQYEVKELSAGKIQVGKAVIDNYSKLQLDISELSRVSDVTFSDQTKFLIFHTHTSEAYEEIGIENNFRTTDDNYNVVAVGNILKENLLLKKFNVLHDITKHDTPSYNGAYESSFETISKLVEKDKYDILIDLHRDALSGNLHFRPTVQINGETSSKLMFVIGTNASGLEHDGWMNNLKLALLIQNTAEEMYPGLFRNLNLAKYRYNQHLSNGAMILEVGSTGNTLEDTKTAMKYFANVLEALKNN